MINRALSVGRLSAIVPVRRMESVPEHLSSDPGPDGAPRLSAATWARPSAEAAPGLFALAAVSGSQAGVVSHDIRVPFSFTTTNACNGDGVAITGTLSMSFSVTNADNRLVNVSGQSNFQGSGVGTSGTQYTANSAGSFENSNATDDGSGAITFTNPSNFHLITGGSGQNFDSHVLEHFTVDANGNVTVDMSVESSACTG